MISFAVSLALLAIGIVPISAFQFTGTFVTSPARVSALEARRRNRSSEGADDTPQRTEIPQLPTFGDSSFDATAAARRRFEGNQNENSAAFVGRKFELQYTCKVCDARNVHKVSRIAYNKGVVIAVCKGCMSRHLISDNLGFTRQFDGNLEDYFKRKGTDERVLRVSEDVFNLEKVLGIDTKSGSITNSDGDFHLE